MRIARLGLLWCVLTRLGCKAEHDSPLPSPRPAPAASIASAEPAGAARASRTEAIALERRLQETKLRPPAWRVHHARLAFARGAFAQLGDDALRIFADGEPRLLLTEPVQGPRGLVTLPDGSLLAADAQRLLRWEPGWDHVKSLPRPVLLPDAELYADALRSDWLWVFEPGRGASPSRLRGYLLSKAEAIVPTPEPTIELGPAGGVLGLSREGVWLYLTEAHAARFAPSGVRLPPLTLDRAPLPGWMLPSSRVDHGSWLTEAGELWRTQVSPSFRRLTKTTLPGAVFSADVGDEGRVSAAVLITDDGPRFELQLLDAQLQPTARVLLPADPPTGTEDWVKVVTSNQRVVVDPRAPRVAVGGPGRATIFDARGEIIFSIPSR
jgi:hypothetical protein